MNEPIDPQSQFETVELIGTSPAIQNVKKLIEHVAPIDVPILIQGESGTGKEVVARLLHKYSNRNKKPFVPVNCAAIPEGLFESEMFGSEKGAYTGSEKTRIGLIEQANQGTLLLDEIGEMPLQMQVKLLRVLETKLLTRVGGNELKKVDFRLVSSTNRDLQIAVSEGRFRSDLFYRIRAVQIDLPPLRKRAEDIPLLIEYFSNQFAFRNHISVPQWTREALNWLSEMRWEGNVRELRWFVEGFLSLDRDPSPITRERVQPYYMQLIPASKNLPVLVQRQNSEIVYQPLVNERFSSENIPHLIKQLTREINELKGMIASVLVRFDQWLSEVKPIEVGTTEPHYPVDQTIKGQEKQAIQAALQNTNGNRREAAKRLGISERTLYRKLKEYGL
ncbi:MAG: sigma-54 dependent transcriptional regulator [bacterium]|nr:sigma-54 dependent transcriptional regulator [bacterium]